MSTIIILSNLVLDTHYVMFPRHETALIHYTGRAVINLGLDFTSRDSVNSYCPKGYATCPVRLFFQRHDELAFSQRLHVRNKIKYFSCLFRERGRLIFFAEITSHKKLFFQKTMNLLQQYNVNKQSLVDVLHNQAVILRQWNLNNYNEARYNKTLIQQTDFVSPLALHYIEVQLYIIFSLC